MKKLHILAVILLVLGGINWGIYGLFDFNLIDYIFGRVWIDRVIYVLFGLSSLYLIAFCKSFCHCKKHD